MAQDTPSYQEVQAQMKDFPCAFNLLCSREPSRNRLKSLKLKVYEEFKNDEDDTEEEKIRRKNLLSWLLHRLGKTEEAFSVNNELTGTSESNNIASLGNRVFILWANGDELEVTKCLGKLNALKSRDDFDNLITDAKAEQAYYHSKLGGVSNIKRAIELYTEVVEKRPNNYLWKYGLGLVYRRATHANIFCSSPERLDVDKCTKMAADYLFEVGENADNKLRGMAFSQLVSLRHIYPRHLYPDYDPQFRKNNIHQLCDKALTYGENNPTVLTQCGRCYKGFNVDSAIAWLERSVKMRKNSCAYHHLGKSYEKKATLIAEGKYGVRRQLFKPDKNSTVQQLPQVPVQATGIARSGSLSGESGYFNPNYSQCPTRGPGATGKEAVPWQNDGQQPHQGVNSKSQIVRSISCVDSGTQDNGKSVGSEGNRDSVGNQERQSIRGREGNSRGRREEHGIERSVSEGSTQSKHGALQSYVRSPMKTTPLQEDDDLVKKAMRCFEDSIKISRGENLPALLDLGGLLKRCGKMKDAYMKFNMVTESALAREHLVTVITAHEAAGKCYLELSTTADGPDKNDYERKGKKKLTQAVILAMDLAKTLPEELTDCAQKVWDALRALEGRLDKEEPSPEREKEKIKLFDIVKKHGEKIEAIMKLRSMSADDLDDLDIIEELINSYLELGQHVDALAFLKAGSLKPKTEGHNPWKSERMTKLKAKVLLKSISRCIHGATENPLYLFQQTFELMYGSCTGSVPIDTECEDDSYALRDVLVVHNEDQDSEEGQSPISKSGHCLKQVLACLFGLDSEKNLEGCPDYGPRLQLQLEEMKKYRVIILLLGDDEGASMFSTLLTMVPSLETEPSCPVVLVVDTRSGDAAIPLVIRHYRSMKVQLQGVDWLNAAQDEAGDQIAPAGILQNVFDGDVEAVMKLFCFVVGLQWPSL